MSTPVIVPDSVREEILALVPQDKILEILRRHYPPETHTTGVEIGVRVGILPPPICIVSLSTELDGFLAKSPEAEYRQHENDVRTLNACHMFPTIGMLARRLSHPSPIHISNRCGPGTSAKMREFLITLGIKLETIGPAGPIEREAILNASLQTVEDLCTAMNATTGIAALAHRRHLKTFRDIFENADEFDSEIERSRPTDSPLGGLKYFFKRIGLTE